MARLPQPGGDKGAWGDVLNDFLSQSHNPDGTFKDIPQSKVVNLAADLLAKSNVSDGINNGWVGDLSAAVFAPAIYENIPVFTFTTSSNTALTSPVEYVPPVIGLGSKTTNWDGQSDANFRYDGGIYETANGSNADTAVYGMTKPGGASQAARWPLVFEFITGATNNIVEMGVYGLTTSMSFMLEVDGQFVTETLIASSVSSNSQKVTLTFPTTKSRRIKVIGSGGLGLRAIRVPTGQSISKPTNTITRRIAMLGDSYVNGAGNIASGGAGQFDTFAFRLARLMGADSIISAGIGGTGFVAGAVTNPVSNYASRAAAILSMNPRVVVMNGSINDGTTGDGVQAAVEATLAQFSSVAEVWVIGTMLNGYEANHEAVRRGTLAAGRKFIDMTGFFTGTGRVTDRKGDGNRDVFLLSDGSHPSFAAHRAIARRIRELMALQTP